MCVGCGGDGYYLRAVKHGHPDFGKLVRCECRTRGTPLTYAELSPKAIVLSEARQSAPVTAEDLCEARRLTLLNELGNLGHCTFDAFQLERPDLVAVQFDGHTSSVEAQRRQLATALDAAEAFSRARPIEGAIIFIGPSGAGKSHLAAAIGHRAVEHGLKVNYATVPAMIDFVRDGFRDHSASDRRAELEATDLLVLDDLDPFEELSKEERLLFQIVNARVLASLPTVATTNFALRHHGRIGSRLAGMAGRDRCIWMSISDYRTREWRRAEQR